MLMKTGTPKLGFPPSQKASVFAKATPQQAGPTGNSFKMKSPHRRQPLLLPRVPGFPWRILRHPCQ
jgi:hypothetical protein